MSIWLRVALSTTTVYTHLLCITQKPLSQCIVQSVIIKTNTTHRVYIYMYVSCIHWACKKLLGVILAGKIRLGTRPRNECKAARERELGAGGQLSLIHRESSIGRVLVLARALGPKSHLRCKRELCMYIAKPRGQAENESAERNTRPRKQAKMIYCASAARAAHACMHGGWNFHERFALTTMRRAVLENRGWRNGPVNRAGRGPGWISYRLIDFPCGWCSCRFFLRDLQRCRLIFDAPVVACKYSCLLVFFRLIDFVLVYTRMNFARSVLVYTDAWCSFSGWDVYAVPLSHCSSNE